MQVILTDFTEDEKRWFIHNDQNSNEYKFTIKINEKSVEMTSSSPYSSTHKGDMAVELLDKLMTSFATTFASLDYMTVLKKAKIEAEEILGEIK